MTNDEQMKDAIRRRDFREIMSAFDAKLGAQKPKSFVNEQHRRDYEKLEAEARLAALSLAGMFCSMPFRNSGTFEA